MPPTTLTPPQTAAPAGWLFRLEMEDGSIERRAYTGAQRAQLQKNALLRAGVRQVLAATPLNAEQLQIALDVQRPRRS